MTPAKSSPTRVAGRCVGPGGTKVTPGLYPALKSTGPNARLRSSQVLVHTPAQRGVLTAMALGCHLAWRAGTQRATGAEWCGITSAAPVHAAVRTGSLCSTAPDSGPTAAGSTPPSWAAGAPAPPGRAGMATEEQDEVE